MSWPWNIRVSPRWYTLHRELSGFTADYYAAECRRGGKWIDCGSAGSWLGAWFMGLIG